MQSEKNISEFNFIENKSFLKPEIMVQVNSNKTDGPTEPNTNIIVEGRKSKHKLEIEINEKDGFPFAHQIISPVAQECKFIEDDKVDHNMPSELILSVRSVKFTEDSFDSIFEEIICPEGQLCKGKAWNPLKCTKKMPSPTQSEVVKHKKHIGDYLKQMDILSVSNTSFCSDISVMGRSSYRRSCGRE